MGMEFFGDIAISSRTNSVIYTAVLEGYGEEVQRPSVAPVLNSDFSTSLWSPWGNNNMLPKEIADDLENCGVLAAAMDAKARISTGKGVQPFLLNNIDKDGKEELEWVGDTEVQDWFELNENFDFSFDSSFDREAYGWNCGSLVLNRGRNKIYRAKRHDVFEARLEKKDKSSRLVKNLYICSDWAKAQGKYDPDYQLRLPLLEEGNELQDLEDRVAGNDNKSEYAFSHRRLRNGRHYYPVPLYRSGKAWIKIARSVPAFKIAMFKNAISAMQEVVIHPKFWEDKFGQTEWARYTPEEKIEAKNKYHKKIDDWLAGEDNAYRSLFTGGFSDAANDGKFTPYVMIVRVDNKLPDGQFLPDSGAANSEILFALGVNPALVGAGMPGGKAYGDTSGGSNIRESFLYMLMAMEASRKANLPIYNIVKKFNGWSAKLEKEKIINTPDGSRVVMPRLVFRYPSGLLTTLDTGKSTKPENL